MTIVEIMTPEEGYGNIEDEFIYWRFTNSDMYIKAQKGLEKAQYDAKTKQLVAPKYLVEIQKQVEKELSEILEYDVKITVWDSYDVIGEFQEK